MLHLAHLTLAAQQPTPTLAFGTSIRISEAFSSTPGAGEHGDGCRAAEAQLLSGDLAVSDVVFDGKLGRLRQSNAAGQKIPTQNLTNIGRWNMPTPQEWDLTTRADGEVLCSTEPLPPVMCPNGTLPPSCPPNFGSWGHLNAFTSIVGMWYPNTSKLEGASTKDADVYQLMDVRPTLLPNDACGTANCTMEKCSTCTHDGQLCTQCPCEQCIMALNVTRNYTYTVAKQAQPDGSHQMIRYQWTQAIPLTKGGAIRRDGGRDCFIFDWSQNWTADVRDSDFAPPWGVKCDH